MRDAGYRREEMITHDRINAYFRSTVPLPGATPFSPQAFQVLADWSERQQWWPEFARTHQLFPDWRSSAMGDSHLFAISLYAFLKDRDEVGKGGRTDDGNGVAR